MIKALGILLAVCFLMSVTAAAVSSSGAYGGIKTDTGSAGAGSGGYGGIKTDTGSAGAGSGGYGGIKTETGSAGSAKAAGDPHSSQKLSKEKWVSEKGLSKKNVFIKNLYIRNLIIAKNIFVFKGNKHPLLRAAIIKRAAMNRGMMEDEE